MKAAPRLLVAAFAGCVGLMVVRFALTRTLVAGDSAWYFSAARSLLVDHDLDLANEYQHFANDVSPRSGNKRITAVLNPDPRTGRLAPGYSLGTSLAVLPFMALVQVVVRGDGYGAAYQLAAGIGSALWGFLGLLLLWRLGPSAIGREVATTGIRGEPGDPALLATLTIWLGTPLVYYMTIEPLMSHAISVFATTALLMVWLQSRDQPGVARWALMGALGGFATIVRYQDAVFCLVPVLDAVLSGALRRDPRRTLLGLVAFAAAASGFVGVQLYANAFYFGSPWITGYPALAEFHWLRPSLFTALFSLHAGLITFAPVTLLCLAGLYQLTRERRLVGALLISVLVLQVYVTAAWLVPDQGAAFGNRMLLSCTPILALGLMRWLERPRPWVSAGFIALNATLALLYCARILPDPYIVQKPVGVVNASPRSTPAHASLTETLRTMSTVLVSGPSIEVPLRGRGLDSAGIAADAALSPRLRSALAALTGAIDSDRTFRASFHPRPPERP
ncbi:MAG TPA: hypothetical protein VGI83_03365 [Gemmatimonadales bacterium]